jgi:hypothetical protein
MLVDGAHAPPRGTRHREPSQTKPSQQSASALHKMSTSGVPMQHRPPEHDS